MTTILAVIVALVVSMDQLAQDKQASKSASVTFADSIGPILKENCSPCHFEGGKIYERYPFDRYETARTLRKRLNTRLKGENAELVAGG